MNDQRAGDHIVDRLARHYNVSTDVDLGAVFGRTKQHIYSMRNRRKRDINHDIIMKLLDELEDFKNGNNKAQNNQLTD